MAKKRVSRNPKDFSDRLLLMKNHNKLCDATLSLNGERISVHANVLASSCKYFEDKFLNSKPASMEVEFQDIDFSALKLLIQYCYTGEIEISEENAKEIIKIANILILPTIIDSSSEILKDMLNVANCVSTWKFAEKENLENLKTTAFEFITKNFEAVSKVSSSEEFLNLDYSDVHSIFSSNKTAVSDMVTYKAVKYWIYHDIATRKNKLIELLKFVNLKCFPHDVKTAFLISESLSLCKSDAMCFQTFNKVLQSRTVDDSKICIPNNTLIAVGSDNNVVFKEIQGSKIIEIFDIINHEWVEIKNVNCNKSRFTTVLIDDKLMFIGGYSNNSITNSVEYYSLTTGQIESLPNMKYARRFFPVIEYKGCIFAIGGKGVDGDLASVEKWDPKSKTWSDVAPLNSPRFVHGAKVVGDEIFIVGGLILSVSSDSVEAYNISTNQWRTCASMATKREGFGMDVFGGYLYVVGGYNSSGSLKTAERYDPKIDKWTPIQQTENLRYNSAVENLFGKLVIVGGNHQKTAESYDEKNNKWDPFPSLKNNRFHFNLIKIKWNLAHKILSKKT